MINNKIAITIVTYNAKDTLDKTLKNLEWVENNSNVKIFIVDNSKKTDVFKYVQTIYPWIQIKHNTKNIGFGAAQNEAYKMAKTNFQPDYILVMNPDVYLTKENFLKLINKAKSLGNDNVGIIGPKLFSENGEQEPSIHYKPTIFQVIPRKIRLKIYEIRARNQLNSKKDIEVFSITGALMLLNAKMIDEIGLFDERFFFYYEDLDLSTRARENNWKVLYSPEISAIHVRGASTSDSLWSKEQTYISQIKYFDKHLSRIEVLILRLMRFIELTLRSLFSKNSEWAKKTKEIIMKI